MHPELIHALHHLLVAAQQIAAVQRRSARLGVFDYAALQLLSLHPGGLTPGELGAYLGLSSGAVTRLITRMQERGHLTREPSRRDGRSFILRATATTRELIRADLEEAAKKAPGLPLPTTSQVTAASIVFHADS